MNEHKVSDKVALPHVGIGISLAGETATTEQSHDEKLMMYKPSPRFFFPQNALYK